MAFSSGFFNSVEGDRKYDATPFAKIFDGIIRDGIFMTIGDCLMVTAGTGMEVIVGTGKAWFNHTWSLNDAPMPMPLQPAEILQDRIDMFVLDVDTTEAVRANDILYLVGTPSTAPVPPILIEEPGHIQVPLAEVIVRRNTQTITQAEITNRVGYGKAPFITGILDVINIDALVAQWGTQWTNFFSTQTMAMIQTAESWALQWETFYTSLSTSSSQQMSTLITTRDNEFMTWWDAIKAILDGEPIPNIVAEIIALKERMDVVETFKDTLSTEFLIVNPIEDSDDESLLDSDGLPINGVIKFCIKPCSH